MDNAEAKVISWSTDAGSTQHHDVLTCYDVLMGGCWPTRSVGPGKGQRLTSCFLREEEQKLLLNLKIDLGTTYGTTIDLHALTSILLNLLLGCARKSPGHAQGHAQGPTPPLARAPRLLQLQAPEMQLAEALAHLGGRAYPPSKPWKTICLFKLESVRFHGC